MGGNEAPPATKTGSNEILSYTISPIKHIFHTPRLITRNSYKQVGRPEQTGDA